MTTSPESDLPASAGLRLRKAMQAEQPLQVVGAINANHALLARQAGFRAIYLSGGGVAAGSLGVPDLGIVGLEDVLTDVRRITEVCPCLLYTSDVYKRQGQHHVLPHRGAGGGHHSNHPASRYAANAAT